MNKNISTHWLVGVMVIGAIVTYCGNKHAESKNDTNVIELLNVMIFTSCPLFSFQ